MSKTTTSTLSKALAAIIPNRSDFSPVFVEGGGNSAADKSVSIEPDDTLASAERRLKAADNALRHVEAEIVRFRQAYLTPAPGMSWVLRREFWDQKVTLEERFKEMIEERGRCMNDLQAAMRDHARRKNPNVRI